MNKLLRVIYETDMRGRHEYLAAQAEKLGIHVTKLKPGNLVAFVNTARDRLMVLGGVDEENSYGVLGYYRSPKGRIDEHALQYIVHAFSGGKLEMRKAIRMSLESRLSKRKASNA